MKDKNNLKNYFTLDNVEKSQDKILSYAISPYSLEKKILNKSKFNENLKKNNTHNIENKMNNHQINDKFNSENSPNNYLNSTQDKIKLLLKEIESKLNTNLNSIETVKNSLNKLKSEKNQKKSEIVNLLSNKESVEEIYKNYIEYLKSRNRLNKKNKISHKKQIKNPFENQDEDAFEILISEIKQIDLLRFLEQSMNLVEEIFENPTKELKLELRDVINKSYNIFNNEINISNFIDTYSVVSNFFLRISIFLSNKSFGKYSETMINLFLRCLVKINSINVQNEELLNYMNGKYKNEKTKLKEDLNKLLTENEKLKQEKIILENESNIVNKNSMGDHFQKEIKDNNEENENKNMLDHSLNQKSGRGSINKKNILKETLKKIKKVYKEDFEGKNGFNNEFYFYTENNSLNLENKQINNKHKKLNEYCLNSENKNINNHEIDQRYNFKINDKKIDDSNGLNKIKNNLNDKYEISTIQNFQYTSPKLRNKKQFYYANNKQNTFTKTKGNSINTSGQGLFGIISNEKKKNSDNKKLLNIRYKSKIITYNDIKKNMKFDLAKKIKYLDKVNKNIIKSSTKSSIQNKKNKLIFERQSKMKNHFTTEKKQKTVKYNFFDIIQETDKLRNNSGDNKNQIKNKLNNITNINADIPLRSTKEKKINGKISNINSIKYNESENLTKSDFIVNKMKSYFFNKDCKRSPKLSSSLTKIEKNGAEKNGNKNINSHIFLQKIQFLSNKTIINNKKVIDDVHITKKIKIVNKGIINKNNKNYVKLRIKKDINMGKKRKEINRIISVKNTISSNNILKNESIYLNEHNCKSTRSDYKKHKEYFTIIDNKKQPINYNMKGN